MKLSDKLNKEDEVNLVLWGKRESVTVIRKDYPELYIRIMDNLQHHMSIEHTPEYLIMSSKV